MKNLFALVSIMICSLGAFGHSADAYTSIIFKDEDGWNLRLTFASSCILEAVRGAEKNYKLGLHDKGFQDAMDEYLRSRILIKANKETEILLKDFAPSVNNHATDVYYHLDNMPSTPLFLDVSIEACKENHHKPINTLIVQNKGVSRSFQLKELNDYQVSLFLTKKNYYQEVE